MSADPKILEAPTRGESEQCVKYAARIKQIIQFAIEKGVVKKSQLLEDTDIALHTLNQFMDRETEKPKNSSTLLRLYRYIIYKLDRDSSKYDKETYANFNKILMSHGHITSYAPILFKGVVEYVGSNLDLIDKVCAMCNGTFHVYRRATLEGRIVKTILKIDHDKIISNMWRFSQRYKDTLKTVRTSSGVVSVNSGNVYCMGREESGIGLDIIVFREPVVVNQSVLPALVMTVDTNIHPIIAKAIIKYVKEPNENEPYGIFQENEIKEEIEGLTRFLDDKKAASFEII